MLGGPAGNSLTRRVLQLLNGTLPVAYDEEAEEFSIARRRFPAVLDGDGLLIRDYGLVVRLSKLEPRSETSGPILLAFGIHGHGTGQAVKAILNNIDMKRTIREIGKRDFYALLRFEFDKHAPTDCQIVHSGSMVRL